MGTLTTWPDSSASIEDAIDARYGSYTSQCRHVAVLQFHPDMVALIEDERWDEAGIGERQPDGSYVLRIPYWEPRDLLPEILRLGPKVRVLEPQGLRAAVVAHLANALQSYDAS